MGIFPPTRTPILSKPGRIRKRQRQLTFAKTSGPSSPPDGSGSPRGGKERNASPSKPAAISTNTSSDTYADAKTNRSTGRIAAN